MCWKLQPPARDAEPSYQAEENERNREDQQQPLTGHGMRRQQTPRTLPPTPRTECQNAHAHHHLVHSSKAAQHVALNERRPGRGIATFTPDLDTRKALPPVIELNVDRGKTIPPGIESQLGPITPDIDTPAERGLPPGIELNADRGKAVPPGIRSQVEPVTPDIDTPAEKALPPGIELNADRGKPLPPGIITPDKDVEPAEVPSEGGDAGRQ